MANKKKPPRTSSCRNEKKRRKLRNSLKRRRKKKNVSRRNVKAATPLMKNLNLLHKTITLSSSSSNLMAKSRKSVRNKNPCQKTMRWTFHQS